jgi:hypothetical protein
MFMVRFLLAITADAFIRKLVVSDFVTGKPRGAIVVTPIERKSTPVEDGEPDKQLYSLTRTWTHPLLSLKTFNRRDHCRSHEKQCHGLQLQVHDPATGLKFQDMAVSQNSGEVENNHAYQNFSLVLSNGIF